MPQPHASDSFVFRFGPRFAGGCYTHANLSHLEAEGQGVFPYSSFVVVVIVVTVLKKSSDEEKPMLSELSE